MPPLTVRRGHWKASAPQPLFFELQRCCQGALPGPQRSFHRAPLVPLCVLGWLTAPPDEQFPGISRMTTERISGGLVFEHKVFDSWPTVTPSHVLRHFGRIVLQKGPGSSP